MIEPIMFFGIGFLVAGLIGLVFIPLVHARAVRLTMRRVEASTPMSKAEIQADKDQLRAEFAMTTRRLEMSVEQMKAKTTSQLAELSKKTEAVAKLRRELGERNAAIQAMETRERTTKDRLRDTEEEFNQRLSDLREKEAELAKLSADLDQRAVDAESQRIEMVALRTQIEALKGRIAEFELDLKNADARVNHEREATGAATQEFATEHAKVAGLACRIIELESQLAGQANETEKLVKRAQELETRLVEQGRQLAQREQLTAQLAQAKQAEADLRAELAGFADRKGIAAQAGQSEKALREQLDRTHAERSQLQRELAKLKRDAESTSAAERTENALLRERINDIAAEIARLTATIEGANSPIEQMLAQPPAQTVAVANGEGETSPPLVPPRGGSLADRIRALQNRATRVSTN
jgi:chromosome segregation ATPase